MLSKLLIENTSPSRLHSNSNPKKWTQIQPLGLEMNPEQIIHSDGHLYCLEAVTHTIYKYVKESQRLVKLSDAWPERDRKGFSMCVLGQTKLVIYGNCKDSRNSLVAIDTETKRIVTFSGPGREGHTAVTHDGLMYVFGGQSISKPTDLINIPNQVAVYENQQRPVFLAKNLNKPHFDNEYTNLFPTNDLFIFNGTDFLKINIQSGGSAPIPRFDHSATVHKDKMYVYGGKSADGKLLADFWTLNLRTFQWITLNIKGLVPPPAVNICMQSYGDVLLALGGWDANGQYCGQLLAYKPDVKQWEAIETSNLINDVKQRISFGLIGLFGSLRNL